MDGETALSIAKTAQNETAIKFLKNNSVNPNLMFSGSLFSFQVVDYSAISDH